MPAPINDNFANATLIDPGTYTGTLVGSTIEANEYNGWDVEFGPGNAASLRSSYPYSVWYKLASYVDPEAVSLTGDDPSAATYACLYIGDNGPGPDSQDNIIPTATVGYGSFVAWNFTAGRTYYVQVFGTGPVDPSTFTLQIGAHVPPDLSADVTSRVIASGTLSGPEHINTTVAALGAAHGTLAINTFYGTVSGHGGPRVAVLQLDDNMRVTSYDGDPWTSGGVAAGAPPLKNDAITYPAIALQEAVGASQDTIIVVENLNLLTVDAHSNSDSDVFAYLRAPVIYSAGIHTYERWIRLRFAEPFNTVQSVRFWSPTDLTRLNTGWDIRWGVTDTYETPVATTSSIATNELPTSDPGIATYDLLDVPAVDGNGTRYSKWLVIQASLSAPTNPGAMLGFTPENSQPVPLELAFAWLET